MSSELPDIPQPMEIPLGGQARSSLGPYQEVLDACLADLERYDVAERIWRGDHTVWKPDPTEITNRLGWLTISDEMRDSAPDLEMFARQIKDEGYRHVVLLGMGGSSLGPEMLRQTFGSASGYPELIVLDSTIPGRIQTVTDAVNQSRTLFLVSSKSGSTIEPNMFYWYFRNLVEEAVGAGSAGRNFIAVTDEGSPLETLGHAEGFRRVFLNPPEIGGRYSLLSYFGLVPAAMIGMDVGRMLDRADEMRTATASSVPTRQHAAAWLGAIIGSLAREGRDKLTLVTSPSISSFGLWAEQLLAESTGKEGKGIIPVAGEPLESPEFYGDDRLFLYLRLEGDDNTSVDNAVGALQQSGQPVVGLGLGEKYDLFSEAYCWEFATAIAGSVLGIHPFGQPNVQSAKDMTDNVLAEYRASGKLPAMENYSSLDGLLTQVSPGDYLAIMAYVEETPELNQALEVFRRAIMRQYRIATTVGYGPRFLHSTGQLHKGGPAKALLLQITADHENDLAIPGQDFSFGALADAQALGDFEALRSSGLRTARTHDSGGTITGGQSKDLIARLRETEG